MWNKLLIGLFFGSTWELWDNEGREVIVILTMLTFLNQLSKYFELIKFQRHCLRHHHWLLKSLQVSPTMLQGSNNVLKTLMLSVSLKYVEDQRTREIAPERLIKSGVMRIVFFHVEAVVVFIEKSFHIKNERSLLVTLPTSGGGDNDCNLRTMRNLMMRWW